jgi:XTP/dITP diphosphohydrolase
MSGAKQHSEPDAAGAPSRRGAKPAPATLVFATRNPGKLAELSALVQPLGLTVLGAAELPGIPEVEEDGATFEENALKKARAVARASGRPALADDSGLEVDALGGAPGVHSARYAGPDADDAQNNARLLQKLRDVPADQRSAHFTCVMALVVPPAQADAPMETDALDAGARVHVTRGRCDGVILEAPRGEGGFGYDPLFWVPKLGASFAELSREQKNRISHRARALQAMQRILEQRLVRNRGG